MIHITDVPALVQAAAAFDAHTKALAVVNAKGGETYAVFQTEGMGSTQLLLDEDDAEDMLVAQMVRERFRARFRKELAKIREEAAALGLVLDNKGAN